MPSRIEPFDDRRAAGIELAAHLRHLHGQGEIVVLALPRGGVPVAREVARALDAPLDVFIVRKLGAPQQPELAMGAIASGGVRVLNADVIAHYGISDAALDAVLCHEEAELERREREYREKRERVEVRDRTVILVDDGLATGATMKAAVAAIRVRRPARIVVAIPVGSSDSCREMAQLADAVVCVRQPDDFAAVGQWYLDFRQITDDEVRALLHEARCSTYRVS